MIDLPFLADICRPTESKIVLLVVDGLGGAPHPETKKSELETAKGGLGGALRRRFGG